MSCDLPTTMRDGRPATWVRITSHRTRRNVSRCVEVEEFYNLRSEHVTLVATADLDKIAGYPSVTVVRRPKVRAGWGRCWE